MKVKSYIYFVLFLLISLFSAYLLTIKMLLPDNEKAIKTFVISSGSQGGNYHKAGIGIEEELNRIATKKFIFKNIPSNGSIENIERLKSRYADFAIVQRDELIKSYHGDGDKLKNISVISPLFQEKLLIYTRTKNHISFKKLKELSSQPSGPIKIGVTTKKGTAYKTFINISTLLSLPTDNIEFIEGSYTELTNGFKNNSIDFILTFSLPVEEIEEGGANLVYFSDEDIFLLTNRMRHFSEATISDDPQYKTLGVWALLIGLNNSIKEVGDRKVLSHLMSNNSGKNSFFSQIKSTLTSFKKDSFMYDKYLSTLPNTPALVKSVNKNNQYNYLYLMPIIILMFIIYFYKNFLKKHNQYNEHWKYLWIRYSHIFIGLIIVITCYLLCIEFLIHNEEVLFNSTGIKSRILDLPKSDLHIWNVVRMFAQTDGGIFPYSLYGKLVTALSSYLTIFGAIAIALSEFGMYKWTAKRRRGKMKIEYEGHVIISGWNNTTISLIEDLHMASMEYHNKSIKIVCVVPDPASIIKDSPDVSDLEHLGKITFVDGDIRNKDVAIQSNVLSASSIILTAEDTTKNADEKTLLRALSVTKFNRKLREELGGVSNKNKTEIFESHKTKNDINSTYIIAEINNKEFVEDLHNAGVNGIVNRGEITKNILIQSLLNPGVSILLNNILSFSYDTNEFYTVDLRDDANKHLRYKTFDELILPLRKQRILLLAIKVIYLDEDGKVIVDVDELGKLLKEDNLNRQIITNPISVVETKREADGDDHLIVLASSTTELKEGLTKVSFN